MKLRKVLVFCGVFLSMMSCTRTMEQDIIPNASETVQLAASIDATKTVNNGDNTVSWVEGDRMSVLYSNIRRSYGSSIFTRTEGDTFTGTVSDAGDKVDWYAIYPVRDGLKTPKDVTYTIPSVQTQTGNGSQAHIAGANLPLYGVTLGAAHTAQSPLPVIPMHHVASVIDFVITNKEDAPIKVNEVKFTSPFDMVGDFSTDLTAQSLSWKSKDAGKTVTLTVTDGAEIAAGGSAEFFATVLPFSGEGEYRFEVTATDSQGNRIVSEKTASKDYDIIVGACTTIRYSFTKTGESTVPAYVKVTAEPESWDGVYLVVDEAAKQAFAIGRSGNRIPVTIDGDRILANESLAAYALSVTDAKVRHANNSTLEAYNVRNADGKYVYFSSEEIQVDNDNMKENSHDGNTYSYYHTFRYSGSGVEMMSSGHSSGFNKYYLGYSGNAFNYTESSSDRVQLYRLSDVDPSPVTPDDPEEPATAKTYTKTNRIEAGKAYIIVSNDNALKNASGSAAAYSVAGKVSGETVTIPAEDVSSVEWVTAAAASSYSSKGDFSFSNGGVMIAREGTNKDDIIFSGNASTRSVWSLDNAGNDLYQKSTSSSTVTLYMQYASGKWTAESQRETNAIAVYVANPSSPVTPPTPEEPGDGEYYVELTSAPASWNGTYLIVATSQGYAFAINENNNRVQVTIDGNKIKATESLAKYALTFKDAGIKHPNSTSDEAYNVFNYQGKYVFYSNSTIQVAESNTKINTQQGMNNESATYYHVFRYDNGVQMMSSGNSGYNKYYLGYSNSRFDYSNGSSSNRVRLYKLDGEGGPDTPDTPVTPVEPTPSGTSFNLENSTLTRYLDDVATRYTNSNYSTTVVESYTGRSAKLDLPNPVSLSWSGSATSISIYEGENTSGTAVKTQSFSSSSTADIYNLIPGRTYSYKTSNGQTGTFNTTGRRRMIKVSDNASTDHARNCRDFGGIETAKGQKLTYGLIYRGTNMDGITDAEKAILRNDLGIKLDVDLRGSGSSGWGSQAGKSVSPLGSDISISNQGYTSGQMDSGADAKLKITVSDILNSVIAGKPVYIHCYIGSDRTGYMCMLLQALLGVSKKECDIDYEITSFASGIVGGTRPKEYTDNKDFRVKFSSNADQTPQAVENYVVNTLGISLDTVKAFRKAMGVSETL